MSYFEHTKADLARERAAGIVETRREVGEQILAILDDTARKLNGETATDENAEREYDRGYLMEDLLLRLASLAGNYVPDAATLFPSAMANRPNPAYPMLIEEQAPDRIAEITQELRTGVANYRGTARVVPPVGTFSMISGDGKTERVRVPLVSEATIREAHNLMTFEGYPRHAFEGSGPDCEAVLHKVYDSEGSRKTCGEYVSHAIHDWRF